MSSIAITERCFQKQKTVASARMCGRSSDKEDMEDVLRLTPLWWLSSNLVISGCDGQIGLERSWSSPGAGVEMRKKGRQQKGATYDPLASTAGAMAEELTNPLGDSQQEYRYGQASTSFVDPDMGFWCQSQRPHRDSCQG